MPKFIIDQALALRTIVEVEADSYDDFLKKYEDGKYQDQISEAQMEWNVEDVEEELFDGDWEDFNNTILNVMPITVTRNLCFDRWELEYKRKLLKTKIK
jgi:hypothetical protein